MIFAWVSLYAYMPVGLSRGASGTFAWAKSVKLWMLEWALTRVRFTVWFGSTWIADGGKVTWRVIVTGMFAPASARPAGSAASAEDVAGPRPTAARATRTRTVRGRTPPPSRDGLEHPRHRGVAGARAP